MRNVILSGAGVKCLINGVNLGIVTGIQWALNSMREEERGIDSLAPFELSPTMTTVNGVVHVLRLRNDAGLTGYGLIKPFSQIPDDEYFTLELKDRVTGSTYLKVEHAAVDSQSWMLSAKGIGSGQFAFHGLSVKEALD